jgi:polyhydroxyalkanoate synthesis regulator phasin
MYKVDRNLLELQNNADMEMLLSLIMKWTKTSESKELKSFEDALFRQLRYIQALEDERFSFDRIVSEALADKVRAVERARKADERIEELEKQIKILETKKKLGL